MDQEATEKDRLERSAVPQPPAQKVGDHKMLRRALLLILAAALVAGAFFGYNYIQDQADYVSTDNAVVTGALVQVGSLSAGQVSNVVVDLGDRVTKDQVVATVTMPSALGATSGAPVTGALGASGQQVPVRSPIDGVVVARIANPGDIVAAGQPLLTVADPTKFWVQAQIEETQIGKIKAGQPVEITVDSLGQSLPGRVIAVNQATASTFSLLPQGSTSGNFTKVTQLVTVKIAIDYGQLPLVLGSSVEVKIDVRSDQQNLAEVPPILSSTPTSASGVQAGQAQASPTAELQSQVQSTPTLVPTQEAPAVPPATPQPQPQSTQVPAASPSVTSSNVAAGAATPAATATPAPSVTKYTVELGDTLAKIAQRYGTTVNAIVQANALQNANQIYPGQGLVIPSASR